MSDNTKDIFTSQLELLGKRIRSIRRRRGMTQAELAGDDITRNMLSRIENGISLPSLTTLCAIASRLDVPIGALFDEHDDYAVWQLTSTLKKLLQSKRYARAIDTFNSSGIDKVPDETALLLCEIFIRRAEELYSVGKLSSALDTLSSAERFNQKSENKQYSERIFMLRTLISACPVISEKSTVLPRDEQEEKLEDIIFNNNDLAVYLYCKTKLSDIAAMPYSQPHESAAPLRAELYPIINGLSEGLFHTHIEAKLDMLNADYLTAKVKLLKLVNDDIAPPMLYELYTDLEFCCKCCGDFENAYKYSNLRIELLKKII